jgi:hypothetical protein
MPTLFNLPTSVPAVTLHAKYLGPDGRPLRGWVEILAPTPLTFPEAQAFVTGPVVIPLDAEGGFTATLPATDVAGSNPSDWAYWITEKLQGMRDRKPYAIKLPQALKDPWLDKLAPSDVATPNYVGVTGSQIFTGTDVPPAGLGAHGDMYIRREITPEFLGITDTILSVWTKVDSTWVNESGNVRATKFYVNNTGTAAEGTQAGDLLLRADTGDVYRSRGTGWGAAVGNLKGPKGDKGDTGATGANSTVPGPQGLKGDTGATGAAGKAGSRMWAFATGGEATGNGVEGDFAIRTDTGNLYQYVTPAGWTVKGSVKGPKGDTGAQGPQGPQGEPGKDGTGAGTVTAVNAVQPDGTGNVALAAGDVGAVPASGTATGAEVVLASTGKNPLVVNGSDGATRFSVTAAGHPYSNSPRATFYNMGIGDTTAPFAGATYGVLGFGNVKTGMGPTDGLAPVNGAIAYASGGKLRVRQSDGADFEIGSVPADVLRAADKGKANGVAGLDSSGKVPAAQLPAISGGGAKNSWTPDALGFAAWSVDPAGLIGYNAANTKYTKLSRLYLSGFNITEPTPVNSVVMFARGYGGVAAVRVMVGIFREDGTRVATSAATNPTGAGQLAGSPPQMTSNHFGAVPVKLSTSPTLQPGRYWGAWVMTAGGTADFAYTHIANDGFAMGNFFLGKAFARSWYMESQTTMPSTVNQGAATALIDHDVPVMALAMT